VFDTGFSITLVIIFSSLKASIAFIFIYTWSCWELVNWDEDLIWENFVFIQIQSYDDWSSAGSWTILSSSFQPLVQPQKLRWWLVKDNEFF
jgi:hypothetical protein